MRHLHIFFPRSRLDPLWWHHPIFRLSIIVTAIIIGQSVHEVRARCGVVDDTLDKDAAVLVARYGLTKRGPLTP